MANIEDYALIGDRHTAALVSREGSIDWLCLPRFDSPAAFAALVGDPDNGRWLIGPMGDDITSTRRYVDDSMVLETTHRTPSGVVRVYDSMPFGDGRHDVVRRIEGVEGTVRLKHEWVVRFTYGKVMPWVSRWRDYSDYGCDEILVAVAGPDRLTLRGPHLPKAADRRHCDEFDVHAGDVLVFETTYTPSYRPIPLPIDIRSRVQRNLREYSSWIKPLKYDGPYVAAVRRSLLTLRALTHEATGGIVAAPTTSLPEDIGGERNWDYRYCWLRDAALTLEALLMADFADAALAWRDWLVRAVAGDPQDVQIMYTVDGGRELPERELDYLSGYEDSRPVRVGNGAVDQRQADVLGEVMIALAMMRDVGADPEPEHAWQVQRALINNLCDTWKEPDNGLWEIRGPKRYFTHSRVMVWAALDRAISGVEHHGMHSDVDRWKETREAVRAEIMEHGFSSERGCFTQHYETTEVDSSLLLMADVGFIDPHDERYIATVQAIEHDLLQNGLLLRYRTQSGVDGLSGDESPFLACSFWLVSAYALIGRLDDAHALMSRLVGLCNDVGLLSEEYDTKAQRQIGNFPQAFSHLALVVAAYAIESAEQDAEGGDQAAPRPRRGK
ncbi:glycoside hydrolase family 15 protein [Cumulibacter manganitolerans]|uniref:glycoside hydrolase family 15 protein n=1 Tax=Cumulibacter manganitolerans TaxID=1884992 RepID=UPI0012977118|nr:glycoside hydrolase family 15 protein [Cumulibacter manganitolerans]